MVEINWTHEAQLWLREIYNDIDVIKRRLETLTSGLRLDYSRALSWSFAQAVLSAIWDVEDGYRISPDHPSLLLANTLRHQIR